MTANEERMVTGLGQQTASVTLLELGSTREERIAGRWNNVATDGKCFCFRSSGDREEIGV